MRHSCAKMTALFFFVGYSSILCWSDEHSVWQGSLQIGSRTDKHCQKFSGQVRFFFYTVAFKLLSKMKKSYVFLPLSFSVAKDYVRLMKYGDSLYRCKQLKRAALGRMCTIIKRQKQSLEYLEQGTWWTPAKRVLVHPFRVFDTWQKVIFYFFCCTHSIQKFPGWGPNLCHSHDLSHSSDYAGSLTIRPPGNSEKLF